MTGPGIPPEYQPWHFVSIRDLVYGTILWAIVSTLIVLFKSSDENS